MPDPAAPAGADERERRVLRWLRVAAVAMDIAGRINISILVIAASLFDTRGIAVETIGQAHRGFADLVGPAAALALALALLASGSAASSVGTDSVSRGTDSVSRS